MKGRRGFTLIELLVVIAIIAILAAILFPVFAKAKRTAQNATCIANMNQVGKALKQYMNDYDHLFPTNRNPPQANGQPGTLSLELQLAPPGMTGGVPNAHVNGNVTWVEGLYRYTEPITAFGDNNSQWKCPAANLAQQGARGKNQAIMDSAEVTYIFNFNVLEQPESSVRDGTKLMVLREGERLMASVCRGAAVLTSGTPTQILDPNAGIPKSVFLGTMDAGLIGLPDTNPLNCKLHFDGSNILFADGHVKNFKATEFGNGDATRIVDGSRASAGGNVYCTL